MDATSVSINRQMDKENVTDTHTHNGKLCSHKKNEILPYAATCIDLEDIMISDTSEDIWYMVSLIYGI